MSPEIDFDESNSELQIGLEVEWPKVDGGEKYIDRGRKSFDLNERINNRSIPSGRCVYDGTVGAEIVSDPLDLADAKMWYKDVIDSVKAEYNVDYQPAGLMDGGSTAGMHVHISDLTEQQARTLSEMSEEPWMHILFCSSIAADNSGVTWPVFRGGQYCRLEFTTTHSGNDHYRVVNRRGPGHWEWRLPEPMSPEHIDILTTFLRAFEQDPDEAVQYAQKVLDDADDRITSIKRAENIGMDIGTAPTIERSRDPRDPENFYDRVSSDWGMPEIYRIEMEGDSYYTFDSEFFDSSAQFNGPDDNVYRIGTVLHADSLEPVQDNEVVDSVRSLINRRGEETRRETEATEHLKDIIKKKKA